MDAIIRNNRLKIIAFLIILFAAWPLLTPGFIPTHDGEYHLIRFFEFDKNIKAGISFPRWAPGLNSGLGVPLFSFFYPLPNYVAEFFHLLGTSLVNSFKLTLATGLVLGSLFFYLWAAKVWGTWAGGVGAVFYTLAPYHLVDVYIRGSIGEVLALALFPAILWALERKSILAAIFLALLILSHNILALIFLPFLLTYLIFRKFSLYFILYTLYFALGLSCYFWLPALIEAKYVTGLRIINFADHFPALSQLLFPSWGAGFSVPGINDQMSFQIGIPHLLVVFLSLLFRSSYTFFFLAWFLLIFFLLLEISLPIWKMIPIMPFFQYPWRLLSLMILITSTLAAMLVKQKRANLLAIFLILLALIFYGGYTRPVKYSPRDDDFYLTNPVWTEGTATFGDTFNTIWLKDRTENVEKGVIFPQDKCQVKELFRNPIKYRFEANCSSSTQAQLNIAYFPGWKVFVDTKEVPIEFERGLINFRIPEGEHMVEVEFGDTPIRVLANRISILSLLFLAGIAILRDRIKKNESRH